MKQHRKLQAARDRRDAGQRPLPGDNLLLLAAREAHNPRSLPAPSEPQAGSRQARVLEMLRCWEAVTVEELARLTDSRPHQVRGALDGLRKKAHYVRRGEGGTVYLRRADRLAAV
ncbi:MAG: DUF3489 domain-containing protein [Planctomycetota bacterium]|jgi:hypothetical protein|nr:DUF3489 domain-containing protein [Planctomycetota bacterium]MDP6763471.1 DUF3489 domain-containing protein [Planctomycetota bacterium]MDP6988839.1 DUF3489 domain-containing protein [Planctomycetota bacterium]